MHPCEVRKDVVDLDTPLLVRLRDILTLLTQTGALTSMRQGGCLPVYRYAFPILIRFLGLHKVVDRLSNS